jgi:hypothetical protein
MPSPSTLRRLLGCLLAAASCLLLNSRIRAGDPGPKKLNDKVKEIAGTAEFLGGVPKHFATLKVVDAPGHRLTLLVEGEIMPKVWNLVPDAEIKVSGWWGRLDQFRTGDRVWVWFKTDRKKQPVAISMIADELSEQDIHGPGVILEGRDAGSITLKPVKGKNRVLKIAPPTKGADTQGGKDPKIGEHLYVQSAGQQARVVLDVEAFELRRSEQKAALRKRWTADGLPGTVSFLHIFSGEMDLILDHEAMRWGRSLKVGDKVTLTAQPPIAALVKHVQPWRERTQLRLVVNSFDQADLTLGQRIGLRMTPPPASVDSAQLPPDLGRPRSKQERIEWFLASIYCTCKVKNNTCTGHFYTLASCNPNGCGMPNHMRKTLAAKIDQGLTDQQIFEELLKEQGPLLLRPHLLP